MNDRRSTPPSGCSGEVSRDTDLSARDTNMMINVLDYLISSAEKHPEKTAVIEEERTVTYSELFRFSCAVGSSLLKYNPFGKPP